MLFIAFMGVNRGWKRCYAFFVAPVTDLYGLGELGVKATPAGTDARRRCPSAFRANVWNIGAEGQLTLGAIWRRRHRADGCSTITESLLDAAG